MPQYEVSSTFYFRENGQKIEAGGRVELTEEQAAERNAAHPGLLKEVRRTTQARVNTVRADSPKRARTRVSRASK